MRKVFWCLLGTGLFLLLLSALVVSTADGATAAAPAPSSASVRAVLMPAPTTDAASATLPARQRETRAPLWGMLLCLCAVLPLPGLRDANGRVVRARRYVSSFYPLFRPEVAGG